MKLKRYLSSLLAIALLASCSNEGILDNNNTPIETVPEGAVAVNVVLPGVSFEPKTYATKSAEDFEKALGGEVRVYVFDNNAGRPGNLVSVEKITPQLGGNTETGVPGKFYMRRLIGQSAHLVATANIELSADKIQQMILRGISFGDFSKQIISQSPSEPNKFPMVSEIVSVTIPEAGVTNPAVKFELKRLAVRVDIENKTVDGEKTKFIVTHARLRNVNKTSYLVEGVTPNLEANMKASWVENTGNADQMKAKVYAYENLGVNTLLDVRGTIGGAQAQFTVEFKKEIKRNYLYKVRLFNVTDGEKVSFSIEVVDWQTGDVIEEISSNDYIKVFDDTPSVLSLSPANASGVAEAGIVSSHELTNSNKELSIETALVYNTRLIVKSEKELKVKPIGDEGYWITVKKVALTEEEKNTLDFGAQAFHISFAENKGTTTRSAILIVEQEEDATGSAKKHQIQVTQAKP